MNGQLCISADDLMQQAFPVGTEMRDDHQGDAGSGRQAMEKPFQGLDAAGGCTDTDDRKVSVAHDALGRAPWPGLAFSAIATCSAPSLRSNARSAARPTSFAVRYGPEAI